MVKTKICQTCGEIKSLDEFYHDGKDRRGRDRRNIHCKSCTKAAYMTSVCPDCGTAIVKTSKRCHSCATKEAWARGAYDGEETRYRRSEKAKAAHARGDFKGMWTKRLRRKQSDDAKARWAQGAYENNWTPELRRKQSEAQKARWANGGFDGIFQSPSKPELIMARSLTNAGLEYKAQYRLGNDGRPFDFYVPILNLLIECDGEYWHSLPGRAESDAAKTALARKQGYMLIRITAQQILEMSTRG